MRLESKIIILTICIFWGCQKHEEPYRFYAKARDAINAKERERGWFPDFIPDSATEIHLQNNLDNNNYWIRFNLPKTIADSLKLFLHPVDAETVKVTEPYDASWWFEGLIEQQPANDAALYSRVFTLKNVDEKHQTIIAFDRVSNVVYVWSFQ